MKLGNFSGGQINILPLAYLVHIVDFIIASISIVRSDLSGFHGDSSTK